jgi:hypothetical protein
MGDLQTLTPHATCRRGSSITDGLSIADQSTAVIGISTVSLCCYTGCADDLTPCLRLGIDPRGEFFGRASYWV